MSTELKIGAGLGVFVVAACAWFFYTRSADHQDIPLAGDQPPSMEKPAGETKPESDSEATTRRPTKPEAKPAASPAKPAVARNDRATTQRPKSNQQVAGGTATPRDQAKAGRTVTRDSARPPAARSQSPRTAKRPGTAGVRSAAGDTKPPARAGRPATPTHPRQGGATLASANVPGEATGARSHPSARADQRQESASPTGPSATPRTGPDRSPAPGAGTRGQPRPATARRTSPAAREHAVQAGESFALIAERYYGSQKYMWFLIQANPQVTDPAKLSIGQVLQVPLAPPSLAPPPEPAAGPQSTEPLQRTYVVEEGDSFYDIARRLFDDGTRWPELYELNKDEIGLDPSNLRVGQVLKIPRE